MTNLTLQKKTVSRSIRLTEDMNERLLNLCDHLGINPNAYLLNAVGKAISGDEVSFTVSKNSNDSQESIAALFGALAPMLETVGHMVEDKSIDSK